MPKLLRAESTPDEHRESRTSNELRQSRLAAGAAGGVHVPQYVQGLPQVARRVRYRWSRFAATGCFPSAVTSS
jgi:hypothetical protein